MAIVNLTELRNENRHYYEKMSFHFAMVSSRCYTLLKAQVRCKHNLHQSTRQMNMLHKHFFEVYLQLIEKKRTGTPV